MSPVWCQPCAGLGRGLGVLVVARHHQRAAHDDLAALAGRQLASVLVHDRDRHQRGRPAGRRQPFVGDPTRRAGSGRRAASSRSSSAPRSARTAAPSPGRSACSASSSRAADIGAAPYQKHCSDEVRRVEGRVVEHHVDQRRRQERVRDPVPLDEPEEPPTSGGRMMTISPPRPGPGSTARRRRG